MLTSSRAWSDGQRMREYANAGVKPQATAIADATGTGQAVETADATPTTSPPDDGVTKEEQRWHYWQPTPSGQIRR